MRRADLAGGRVRYANTKNGRVRIMPLSPELHAEALSVGQEGEQLFSYSSGAFRSAYRRTGLKTPQQPTHILRHTFASHFIMNGGSILELQKILGHTDLKITMRYAHLSPDHLARVLDFSPMAQRTELLLI
ncbi:tyrosine-type recombinase/integrase [Alcanivorax sp. IL3]|uniref:tyrosine-type recombinase/integrase n=1 Tax=unclassified Alcanivorax TaxID=2638842 RepID=UPI0039C3F55F